MSGLSPRLGARPVNQGMRSFMTAGRLRLWLVLTVISLGMWIVFAKLVVPVIIESAYRGESWSFLNRMISGQATHPVSEYIRDWDTVTIPVLLTGLGFWLIVLVLSSPAFFRRIVGTATPGSLGAIRMWTCLILLLGTLIEDLPSIALVPAEMRQSLGLTKYLYTLFGFERLVTSEASLRAFQWLTELILFLGLIGWRTRLVIPLGALCTFVFVGVLIDYSFFWHQNLVPLYVITVLSFTPCGDGWSIDRLWKISQGRTVLDARRTSPVYGWSRYACWVTIALPYVANGLGKLRDGGVYWWNATNMRTNLYLDTLNPREFDWALSLHLAHFPDVVFSLLGIVALCSEILFGMVLFSRVARRILPVAAIMMHIGILLLQRILFFDLILLQLVFFDFTPLRKAIGGRLSIKRGRLQVLYDGLCPLCCRTVRLLTALDLFTRLEFLDFRHLDLDDYNRRLGLNLALRDLEEEMYVVFRGKAYRGFGGYRRIALAVPAFWPLAPWLFSPGIFFLGASVYARVARNRRKVLWCDSHCPVRPSEERASAQVGTTGTADRGFGYALAVSGMIVIALLCWFFRIEYYPLTSWHLYSGSDTSGQVEYKKVFARSESGEISPARLEEGIGALALDGRYIPALDMCIEQRKPRDAELCKKFLTAMATAYNQKARPGRKVTAYELQVWTWDFRSNPGDPHYGNLTKRFTFEIEEGGLSRARLP